jgi:hypothetical protein
VRWQNVEALMVDRDDLQRSLTLAKSALRAPPAVRARVRAGLAAGVASPLAARSSPRPTSQALVRAALWLGLGVCAGYWLGFHRVGASLGQQVASADGARVSTPAPGPSEPLHPAGKAQASTAGDAIATGDAEPTEERRPGSAIERGVDKHSASLPQSGAGNPPSSGSLRARRRSEPDSRDTFGAELALLGRAERAIRAGEGALARSFLDELEQKFPASSLREERAAARVLAGCAEVGSSAGPARQEAQAAATRFLSHSSSMYADRVRALCELGPHDGASGKGISGNGTAGGEDPSQRGH